MTANVAVVVNERENILLIPNAALRARIPDNLLLPPAAAPSEPGSPAAAATPEENLKALLAEAGFTGEGRPTRETMQKVRAVAAERGLVLPERGSRRNGGSATAVITRTVYQPAGTPAKPMVRPVSARFGITDGSKTEVVSGLEDGATIVTGVTLPSEASATGTSNPFGGGFRRF